MHYKHFVVSAACLLGLLVPGPTVHAQVAAKNYVVGPQDVLKIAVVENPGATGSYTVQADGTFTFPDLGTIKAGGLTIKEVEELLTVRLGPPPKGIDFYKNPHVTVGVELAKSQKVIIMGPVVRPGPFPLTGDMTLLELIAEAGSLTSAASGEVTIIRQRKDLDGKPQDPEMIQADMSKLQTRTGGNSRVLLQADDLIQVAELGKAYIQGEVKNPGAYTVQKDMTVNQMLATAGGATPDAAQNRISIERTDPKTGKHIKLEKVKPTEIVKPGDTVLVPTRFM